MRKGRIRILSLLVLILFILGSSAAAERVIPDILRVTQETESRRLPGFRVITRSVLYSAREDVNDAINARVAALLEEAEPLVPRGRNYTTRVARADVCTQITRTGDRWMSFHLCAQISVNNNQQWVKSEEYTYNMESGALIRLGNIICEDGWKPLIREIQKQVENSFPDDEPDKNALNVLCRRENLESAGFVMAPGHLALYFPAADVYPAHAEELLRVEIYFPSLREILTEQARQEADCSGYPLVALTYDDGPSKGTTRGVLDASVRHPGQITFFVTGHRIMKNAELLHKEFDAGHSVQSHTWAHATTAVKPEKVIQWENQYNQLIGSTIGVLPVMMRPPGGNWKEYLAAGCKMPMILWSLSSQDSASGESKSDMLTCEGLVGAAKDGDIILFHDIKIFAGDLAERCMRQFEEKNILLVTVNDLCALRGVTLEPGLTLKNCPGTD